GGGYNNLPHGRAAPARFQDGPSSTDIGLEGRDRIPVCDGDDGLRSQMNDRINLILAERALDERLVAHAPLNCSDALAKPGTDKFGLRNRVSHETHDIGADRNESFHQPSADQPGGPGDESGTIRPEPASYCQIRHGALSWFQSSLR